MGLWLRLRPFLLFRGDMATITDLRPQRARRERISVYLDGDYAFSLAADVAASLAVGQELDEGALHALQAQEAVRSAYDRALRYLTYRPRSEWEMRRYLQQREVPDEAAEEVMRRLRRQGLLDDCEFARYWVENRQAFRPRGRRMLHAELRRKGVERAALEPALETVDEEAGALQAARPMAQRLADADSEVFRRRVLGHLQRRGYGYEVARRVLARLSKEVRGTADDGL